MVNSKFGAKIQYSTLSRYFAAVKEEAERLKINFPVYTDTDFFPYADNDQSYWTVSRIFMEISVIPSFIICSCPKLAKSQFASWIAISLRKDRSLGRPGR